MMKIYSFCWVISILLLSLSACNFSKDTRSLDELKVLDDVDQIRVYGREWNENGEWTQFRIKTIDDPKRIKSITKTVSNYADNWQFGQYYPYLPGRLTVTFYSGETPKASIMIVARVTKTASGEQTSYFLSKEYGPAKPIEATEFKGLIQLLEVDEDLARFESFNVPPEAQ